MEHANRRLAEIGAADRLTAVVGSAYEPPEGPFDLIALTDVLEHLEDPRRCLAALRAQLAPDGLLVISTPNRRSLPGARRWLAERGVPGIRLNLAPIDEWQTWTDLEGHAASAGLVPVSRRGIFFRPGGRVGLPDRPPLPVRAGAPRRGRGCRARRSGGSASTSAWGSGRSEVSPAPPGDGRDRVRRGVVAAAMLALFVIALGIFLLPFAFPTPPPIVTRFQATQLFSPNGDGRRDVARVNIRLHEASDVTVEIQKDGKPVVTLIDDERRPRGFRSTEFFGRDRLGRLLPDDTYAIKLVARSGDKKFEQVAQDRAGHDRAAHREAQR